MNQDYITFYKKCLSDLLKVKNPTYVMKKVIHTIITPNESIYIYDLNQYYATLFLSDEMCTVYLYPDLRCSLLTPPSISTIPHWSTYMTHNTYKPIDTDWLYDILNQTPDKDILNDFIKTSKEQTTKEQATKEQTTKEQKVERKEQTKKEQTKKEQATKEHATKEQKVKRIEQKVPRIDSKSDSSDGPDFGIDFGKEFDFNFVDIKPQKVQDTKKIKNVKRPVWK